MIDPDIPLLAKLIREEFLMDEDKQSVQSKDSLQKRNDMLLDFVHQKKDLSLAAVQFTGCLLDTDQNHVYHFIRCNGGKQMCYLACFKSFS